MARLDVKRAKSTTVWLTFRGPQTNARNWSARGRCIVDSPIKPLYQVKCQVSETAGDSGPGSLSQSFISHYRESKQISRDDAPTQGWLTKDGALELFSLSLNNIKGFSKKAMIFSEFQAFRSIAFNLVDNSFDPRFG
jgi:hypothetical protein